MWAMVLGMVAAATATAGPRDYFSEHSKDFGVTPRGPLLTHYFFVTNSSDKTVTLGQARVSCGCVRAEVLKGTLAPGETTAVAAYMDTRRIQYSNSVKSVIVYVPFLSPTFEEVQLKVQSIARDDLMLAPASLEMGTIKVGTGAKATTKVTFLSDANWKVTDAKSNGGFVKADAKELSRVGNQVTYEVTASLDSKCPAGNWTAEIWLTTSNAAVEKIRIPLSVNVERAIAINPEAVRLNGLESGKKTEHRIQLKSDQPFQVTDVKGGGADLVIETQEKEATVVQTLKVTVTPAKSGSMERNIEVTTNHPHQKSITIPFKAVAK
jgi:hypothetical protein